MAGFPVAHVAVIATWLVVANHLIEMARRRLVRRWPRIE
ncbi:hypothetical protein G155_00169 [Mycobacterium sp. VKM Ac-1817D]|nr:hypothetical protein G155_00169 [Mycobacterium sp. VKM Ac-1817D]